MKEYGVANTNMATLPSVNPMNRNSHTKDTDVRRMAVRASGRAWSFSGSEMDTVAISGFSKSSVMMSPLCLSNPALGA